MSKENLDQFIQKVTDDEQLQTRIGEEIDADSLIALGAECGCEFTAEELQESAELSDEELDGVAGGVLKIQNTSTTAPVSMRPGQAYYFYNAGGAATYLAKPALKPNQLDNPFTFSITSGPYGQ
jgi:predicted ribosomally synthesized peptide with nif11-like leader